MVNYPHFMGPKSVAKFRFPETPPGITCNPSKLGAHHIENLSFCKRLKKVTDSPMSFLGFMLNCSILN